MRTYKPIRDIEPYKAVVRRGARAWKIYKLSKIRKIMNRAKWGNKERWFDF
jgi:hypothetical protein